MDLFNRKKVAALESELSISTAQLEATEKEFTDLQNSVINLYTEIEGYFKPRYINKYYKLMLCDKPHYVKCVDVEFHGGFFDFSIIYAGTKEVKRVILTFNNLKMLSIISKKEYIEKGEQK